MLSENWKILLDYKSECNIKNIASVDRACVCLFWVVKLFHVRLQNNPHFCVFKYARAVKQKVERGWTYGRVRLALFARLRLLRHASPISLLILRKKPTVLQSSFTLDLWQTTSASTTRQWEIQKQRFGRQYTVFFSRLFKHSKQGSSYRGWIYMERSEGKQKLLRVSGRFELPGGKITVNVWRKSKGNRFWFEFARGSS